jgi:heme-degrading monooxygenase HmoA
MIARVWRGVAHTAANADAYLRYLTTKVLPSLVAIPGHCGARVLRREERGHTEFLVMTYWDSMDAVRGFAGESCEQAVVEPEARAVLGEYDDCVRHYEVER